MNFKVNVYKDINVFTEEGECMNQYIIITTTFDNKDELDKVSK